WLPLSVSLSGNLGFQEVLEQTQLSRQEALDWQEEWDCNPDVEPTVSFTFHEWSSLADADGVQFSLERLQVDDHPQQLQLACDRAANGLTLRFQY
ncbi:hypothetical protein, partial [Tritonibacter sp. SIMBA_163]|uniref:hypothetical protein n=1 Tax=Tritonibacter sp. SIMBA_163 TaxID=3080868 RepID=UPI00397ED708